MTAAFLWHWFDFPNGSVLTNLVATVVVVAFGAWRLIKRLNKIHEHLDLVHAHVKLVHEHQLRDDERKKPPARRPAKKPNP